MAAIIESADCIQRLKDGNARYVAGQLKPKGCGEPGHRDMIDAGQAPKIGLIGCADSRVAPDLIFDADAGEMFVTRVAGNVCTDEIIASLEYAVANLTTEHLCVYGHSKCGAIKAALATKGKPQKETGLSNELMCLMEKCEFKDNKQECDDAVKQNTIAQMELLKNHFKKSFPRLTYSAAHFDFKSGKVDFLVTA